MVEIPFYEEVTETILKLKPNKSPGQNNIPASSRSRKYLLKCFSKCLNKESSSVGQKTSKEKTESYIRSKYANLKNDFYNVLIGKRILVIVNYDIDGICASKILQSLFKYEHMLYTVVPVMGVLGCHRAYMEHKEDVKFVVLINCGGCIDIVEVFQPDEDVIFFVCDSHRPMDVCNIYSDNQIRILGDINPDDGIPSFDDIFKESDDEDDENIENDISDDDEQHQSRAERFERQLTKRREKRKWEENRNKIMFDYTQYSYYGKSSALLIFELAWKLTKDSMDLLWWAIVGITEQLVLGKIESSAYILETNKIQLHVSRLTNKNSDNSLQTALKINLENDLHLALYRHWSVHDSLKHSMYSACKLKLWTARGEKRLQELLVEMGLPLIQAKQTFTSMDLVLRKEFYEMIEKLSAKYNLPDIVYGSFTLQYGYRNRYSASDYVYSMLAILESIKKDRSPEFCFLEALDSLSRTNKHILDNGINKAKQFLNVLFRQVQSSLEMHQVHSAGPFLYFILNEENPYFSCPYGLTMLAKFVLRGHVAISKNRRAPELPLIASCPIDVERGLCLMVGVAPVCEDSPKNFFGKAFEQAAQKSHAVISQDFFETSVIQIKQSDVTKFLDGLTVLLS